MSYQGFAQCLCSQGHLYEINAYETNDNCPICQSECVFYNGVDDTNGEMSGYIPDTIWQKLIISPMVQKTCDLGHTHIITYATYKVPAKEDLSKIRYFLNPNSYNWEPLQH